MRSTKHRLVGVRMHRSQTEPGALVIDAGSGTPCHALAHKTTAEQEVCRSTGVKFADIPPSTLNCKTPGQSGRGVVTRAPHG